MYNSLRTFCVVATLTLLASWPAAAQMIDSADIVDGSIQGVDVKNGSLTGADIQNRSITASDLAAGAIGSGQIKDGSIVGADIKNRSLTGADIATGAIGSRTIKDGTIQGVDLADGAVTLDKLNANVTALGHSGRVVVGAASVRSESNSFVLEHSLGHYLSKLSASSSTQCGTGQAHLPDGVNITEVLWNIRDMDSAGRITMDLLRASLTSSDEDVLAGSATNDEAILGDTSLSNTNDLVDPIVDLTQYYYFVRVCFPSAAGPAVRFYSAVISYE